MNLIELILENGGPAVVQQLARKVGLPETQAMQILNAVLPALGQGLKRNLSDPGRAGGLLETLSQGSYREVAERPEKLIEDATVEAGNQVLGQVFGSKEVSRQVAARVAERTGADTGIVKQLLPLVASLAMGVLGKETEKRGLLNAVESRQSTTLVDNFMEFLDMDDDGSVVDDLFDIARKFL